VTETLLITLYIRAVESQRPDALIKDEKAVAPVTKMSYDFARIRLKMPGYEKVTLILRDWPTFDGCAISRSRPGLDASTTSTLEGQQGENTFPSRGHRQR